eukprot:1157261-Amphidinium_carterae.1
MSPEQGFTATSEGLHEVDWKSRLDRSLHILSFLSASVSHTGCRASHVIETANSPRQNSALSSADESSQNRVHLPTPQWFTKFCWPIQWL